jgi:putative ABC transport system permease protein
MLIGHYLHVALIQIRRAPFAASVNVLTLAVGLFCFLIAVAFANFWVSAERHFSDADRIHVLVSNIALRDGSFAFVDSIESPPDAAEHLRLEFPELERIARASLLNGERFVSAAGRSHRLTVLAADAEFLRLFDLPLLSGDDLTTLDTPSSAVLTVEAAERLYGSRSVVGRSLLLDNEIDLTVTGVSGAIPEPSHLGHTPLAPLRFDLLVSHDVYDAFYAPGRAGGWPGAPEGHRWMNTTSVTYLLLPRDGSLSPAALKARLADFAARHIPSEIQETVQFAFDLMPVSAVLRRSVDASIFPDAAVVSVSTVLLLLGGLLLGIACINSANLAIAQAARRAREAGLRKALGARPSQVIAQHLTEATLLTALALLLAVMAFQAARPLLATIAGFDPGGVLLEGAATPMLFAIIVLAAASIAGGFPALVLSHVAPMAAIRGPVLHFGTGRLAAWLLGAQFVAAAFLLITVAVIWMQNAALERTGLGRTTDPLLAIPTITSHTNITAETLRDELARIPQVRGVTGIGQAPWLSFGASSIRTDLDPASAASPVLSLHVGPDFFDVFEMSLIAGRALDPDLAADYPPVFEPDQPFPEWLQNVVVDRAFLAQFGFASPADALGAMLYSGIGGASMFQQFRIVGVVDTVPWQLLRFMNVRSAIYLLWPNNEHVVARISADDVTGALAAIDAAWNRLSPDVPIERRFIDEMFEQAFSTFARISQVFTLLALIAIVIAAAGLIAMATLVAGRRMREVAIRKTHGARTLQVVVMLLASFTKPILIANLIAWPVAWIAASAYLEVFLNPIALTVSPFLASLAFTLAIAWTAIAGQTLRAARAAPADVLRHE